MENNGYYSNRKVRLAGRVYEQFKDQKGTNPNATYLLESLEEIAAGERVYISSGGSEALAYLKLSYFHADLVKALKPFAISDEKAQRIDTCRHNFKQVNIFMKEIVDNIKGNDLGG